MLFDILIINNMEEKKEAAKPVDTPGNDPSKDVTRESKFFLFSDNNKQQEGQEGNDEDKIRYDDYIEKELDKMKEDTASFLTEKVNSLKEKYDLLKTKIKEHISLKVSNISLVLGLDQKNIGENKNGDQYIQNYASKNISKQLNDIFDMHGKIMQSVIDNINIFDSFLSIGNNFDTENPIQSFLSSNLEKIYNSWLFLALDFNKYNLIDMFSSQKIPKAIQDFIITNSSNRIYEMVIDDNDIKLSEKEKENKELVEELLKEKYKKDLQLLKNNMGNLTKISVCTSKDYFSKTAECHFPKLTKIKFSRCEINNINFQEVFPACVKLSIDRCLNFKNFDFLDSLATLKLQRLSFNKDNLITAEFNKIINFIVNCKEITNNLTYLSFTDNYITAVDLSQYYTLKLPKLKELDFRKNKIFKFSINPEACPNIKLINLAYNNLNKSCTQLLKKEKTIVLANNNIYLTTIENIDTYYQRIKYQLASFNYGMNYLSLSGLFNINTKGNILSIDIHSNIQISVTKLDLSYCSLTCETLFKFFENNPGFLELRSLNLSNNNLTDDFFSLFLKNKLNVYFQKLSHLNLSGNAIKGTDFASVAEFIRENKYLTKLDLGKNPFAKDYSAKNTEKMNVEEKERESSAKSNKSGDSIVVNDFVTLYEWIRYLNTDAGMATRYFNKKERGFLIKYDVSKRYNYDNERHKKYIIEKKVHKK